MDSFWSMNIWAQSKCRITCSGNELNESESSLSCCAYVRMVFKDFLKCSLKLNRWGKTLSIAVFFYLIEPEDRGHFSHKGGEGHGDLVNNFENARWGHCLNKCVKNRDHTRDLHLDPCKVVANLKVLSHEEVEGGRGLWSHLQFVRVMQQTNNLTRKFFVATCAIEEEQCFKRHLQSAAQCSVASSNNKFGYLHL